VSSADSVVSVLSRARRTAVESSTPVEVTFDPTMRRWWVHSSAVDTSGVLVLASGVGFADTSKAMGRLRIRFDPRGPTTSDRLRLDLDGRTIDVTIDPWTGATRAVASR
jgi:Tfp pilus assembly protein FimT